MKNLAFIFVCVALISCSSNNAADKSKDASNASSSSAAGDNIITFKANGETVNTTGLVLQRFILGDSPVVWLNITSNMHDDKRTLNVNLNGSQPGTYKMVSGNMKESMGTYFPDYSAMSDSYMLTSGTYIITEVDTVRNIVNGSFSAEAVNQKGDKIAITDGKIINGKLTPGINDPSKMAQ